MDANQFNELTARHLEEKLGHLPFKKAGTHHFLHDPPGILVLFKYAYRGWFAGFYIAVTYDFVKSARDSRGKFKLPGYMEGYPVSIALPDLKDQYRKHKTAFKFDYDMNFMTREVAPTRQFAKKMGSGTPSMDDDRRVDDYIKASIDILANEGMQFFKECSPLLAHKVLTKFDDQNICGNYDELIEIEQFLRDNNIEVPRHKIKKWEPEPIED